jgi:hypothetical protein
MASCNNPKARADSCQAQKALAPARHAPAARAARRCPASLWQARGRGGRTAARLTGRLRPRPPRPGRRRAAPAARRRPDLTEMWRKGPAAGWELSGACFAAWHKGGIAVVAPFPCTMIHPMSLDGSRSGRPRDRVTILILNLKLSTLQSRVTGGASTSSDVA